MNKPIIACAVHDYIETACLYGYHLELALVGGERITGIARTTETEKGRGEFLCLDNPRNRVEMMQIRQIKALTANPYFAEIPVVSESQG